MSTLSTGSIMIQVISITSLSSIDQRMRIPFVFDFWIHEKTQEHRQFKMNGYIMKIKQ